ncbi:hypothetical protein CFter6_0763 [Collimonas fungivorans]|uniref:Uncharacterized protein n=1 Tax=Collimonas fungivorans TaxID=158899 RepID=A0A127P6Y4_9BURK|nr:hypothetical protein CFter6_0763 [Collimonas fungivorans]
MPFSLLVNISICYSGSACSVQRLDSKRQKSRTAVAVRLFRF